MVCLSFRRVAWLSPSFIFYCCLSGGTNLAAHASFLSFWGTGCPLLSFGGVPWLPPSFPHLSVSFVSFGGVTWLPPSFLPLSFSFLSFWGVTWHSFASHSLFLSFWRGPGSPPFLSFFLDGGLALPLPSVIFFFLSEGGPGGSLLYFFLEGSWTRPLLSFFLSGGDLASHPSLLACLLSGGPFFLILFLFYFYFMCLLFYVVCICLVNLS